MKKLIYLVVIVLISSLVLTGCSLLSNVGQVPANEQSGITYLTKALPLQDDLVGLWHFSGDADDSSGNDNDGIVDGETEYIDSPMGQAFSFDGNTCVLVDDSDSLDITRATLEAWVMPSGSFSQRYARIVFKGTNSPFVPLYFLAYDGPGTHMRMVVYINGVAKSATSITTLTDPTRWYHIAGTYDGTDVKIYVDGTLEGTTNVLGDGEIDTDIGALGIGRNPEADIYGYRGFIDEVRIWKVALSEGQLRFIYDFGGFLPPVENPGIDGNVINVAKAGRAIPVKFSLNGDQGLDIFEPGYPKSVEFFCSGESDPNAIIVGTDAAGGSILSYDAIEGEYVYVWKTEKKWAEQCRQLVVRLNDGKSYYANFQFK